MMVRMTGTLVALVAAVSIATAAPSPVTKAPSVLAESQVSLRYSSSLVLLTDAATPEGTNGTGLGSSGKQPGHKSPGKAFLLSAAIPGLGQLYNGSKIKAAGFFAADVAVWVLHFKWHKDGDNMTDAFNLFNETHWSRADYSKYLLWTYGADSDTLIDSVEISHHLPTTNTQQYYEMTGKYNQFAWGWDDAALNGDTLEEFSAGNPPPPAVDANVPVSANRMKYEQMRADANNRYDRAQRMIIVAMVNRLISGFEAYLSARHHNARAETAGEEFSRISVGTSMRSVYTRWDTPYLNLAYRF
jgi:hypothetical protein